MSSAFANAILLISNSEGEFIAIPVANFPNLPIGSDVSIFLTDNAFIEDATIKSYSVSSRRGIEIELNLNLRADVATDKKWNEIAAICDKDKGHLVDFIYPSFVDFNVKYEGRL